MISDDPKASDPNAADDHRSEEELENIPSEDQEYAAGLHGDYDGEARLVTRAFSSGEFHNVIQKQIAHAALVTLTDNKMNWELIEPFLEAARSICRGDFEAGGQVQIHSVTADGDDWVEAEEAFIGVSAMDQDDGNVWLSETYWLSDVLTASGDPEQVRASLRAIERSMARVNEWLAAQEAAPPGDAVPSGAA
jgi:hypothetical protein